MISEKSITRLSRDRILDVARRHFTRFGYRKASLSEIATDLGVVKGALYYHVPGGKRELLDAVMSREDERMIAAMSEAAEAAADPREALVRAFQAKLAVLRELKDLLGVRRDVSEEIRTILVEKDRDFTLRERALIESVMERGVRSGTFRDVQPRAAAAAAIQVMCQALEVSEMYEAPDGNTPSRLDAMFDLVLLGLVTRG